jgi:hypothetical protein
MTVLDRVMSVEAVRPTEGVNAVQAEVMPTGGYIPQPYVMASVAGHQATALLDQGCLPANLMSEVFWEKIKDKLPEGTKVEEFRRGYGSASAEAKSGLQTSLKVELPVKLNYAELEHECVCTFVVANCGREIMMGWGYIHQEGYQFNAEVVAKHHDKWLETQAVLAVALNEKPFEEADYQGIPVGSIQVPFAKDRVPAAEDAMIPESKFAPEDLIYTGTGSLADDFKERLQGYRDNVMKQVNPEFLKAMPELEEYLLSEEVARVFIPEKWEGLCDPETGEAVVHQLEWLTLPTGRKLKVIRVRPEIVIVAKKEVEHLKRIGFWVYSDSHIASSMLVAPKATDPWIRLVTDYSWLTPNLSVPKHPLKHVKDSLSFMTRGDVDTGLKFQAYCDLDMMASFHQIKIDDPSSERLSVVSPWGQYRPRFLPEGIAPATAILQKTVDRVFNKHKDRMLCIYDNLLLAGTTPEDMLKQLKDVLETCRLNNMYLKYTKCWFGSKQVKFFGYICTTEKYYLDEERVQGITEMEFPGDVANTKAGKIKAMQTYLGMAQFFGGFIDDYSTKSIPLTDMTRESYDWTDTTQARLEFKKHQELIANSFELFHPNYDWEWVYRVDASQLGCGGVLCQKNPETDKLEPLAMVSMKFTEQTQRWHCMHQEAFAIMWCILKSQVLLRGKEFVLESDHRNLIWMEKSTDAKIVRMCEALRTFQFKVRHIPGRINLIADVLSRMFPKATQTDIDAACVMMVDDEDDYFSGFSDIWKCDIDPADFVACVDILLGKVHGGRMGHHGVLRTWYNLNRYFPGHGLSVEQVREYISRCMTCQKTRLRSADRELKPVAKHLVTTHARHKVAIDGTLVVKVKGELTNLLVVYNLFTKLVALYVMRDKTALSAARAIFTYFVTYGMSEVVHSDLGSDFTSTTVYELLDGWCGVRQTFALQRNPQADGVEPMVKEVLRHITALMYDVGDETDWAQPENLGAVQLCVNEYSESGVSALAATFGELDAKYFDIPAYKDGTCSHPYVERLGRLLGELRAKSLAFHQRQHALVDNRKSKGVEVKQNRYQPGDFVLYKLEKLEKPTKVRPKNKGPYKVIMHKEGSNHVEVRDLVYDHCLVFDCKDLTVCVCSPDEAIKAARKDDQQHQVEAVIAFRGEHLHRTKMTFLVRFGDGDEMWLNWSPDITNTKAFEEYCMSSRYKMMQLLVLTKLQVKAVQQGTKRALIPVGEYGSTVYVNLRSYGADWYDGRDKLPDKDTVHYYVKSTVERTQPHNPRKCVLVQPVFGIRSTHDLFYLNYFGDVKELIEGEVELTEQLCKDYGLEG